MRERDLQRIDQGFTKDLRDIQKSRLMSGKDDPHKPNGIKRLTKGITRHPRWLEIKNDLKKADLPRDRRGSFNNLVAMLMGLVIFVIVAFVVVIIASVWVTNFGTITDKLVGIDTGSNVTNISKFANITFGNLNLAFAQFRWISIVLLFGMAIGILVSGFLVKVHPVFFGAYIILALVMVFVSIFIANSYETLFNSEILGPGLQSFRGASNIVLYLPIWTTVLAFVGGILVFVSMRRDSSQGPII